MTTTTSASSSLKEQLVSALEDREVGDAETLADSLGDLAGRMATIAFWDDYAGTKSVGLLVHMLKTGQHRDYAPKDAGSRSFSARFGPMVADMERTGFSARLAPWAAMSVACKGLAPKVQVMAHLRETRPLLFDDEVAS